MNSPSAPSFLDSITKGASPDGGTEAEPAGDDYRPVWRTTRPASLDIRMGSVVQFNVSYAHILLTASAPAFFSAFWIIMPFMTITCEGENLRDVVQSIGDRKARAIYLFEPDIHKTWDETQGRILLMQPVLVPSDAAFKKAAAIFGYQYAHAEVARRED